MKNKKIVFLTGATGLVGSYLLKVLLNEGYKVYVLSRSKDNKDARDRVINILKFWDRDVLTRTQVSYRGTKENEDNPPSPPFGKGGQGGLVVLEGDITEKILGLNKQKVDLLKNEIEEIFHCAAITQFNWPLEKIRRINVDGTKNVLELALKCNTKGIFKKVNHISTAYVCGDYKGIFKEHDLDVGQKFNSTYEQSKFEAEKLVDVYRKKGLWIDIFRPPIVVGESSTGKTNTFQQSVYQLLHIWNLEIFECVPAKGFCFNAAFIDDLCETIFKISSSSLSVNKNYHPFNCKTVSLERFMNYSSKFLGFKKPEFVSRDEFLNSNPTPAQKMLLANNIFKFNNDVRLDSTITNTTLKENGFKFSGLTKSSLSKLLNFCVKEGFVKKL